MLRVISILVRSDNSLVIAMKCKSKCAYPRPERRFAEDKTKRCLHKTFIFIENLLVHITSEVKWCVLRCLFPRSHNGHDAVINNNNLKRENAGWCHVFNKINEMVKKCY
jgi:hypothetical protein